jgi:quercetin dioxygenase-like cupin family protein
MAKRGRVFLKGMSSEQYGLKEFRDAQLAAPRVRSDSVVVDDARVGHSGDSADSRTWWRVGPGDDPFLTQNIQVHFVEIPAGKSNHGHGHQNEAVFYILQGSGYEIHDDKRYPWQAGDLAVVHTDSVHRHFNDGTETAKALVLKAKSTWMYFGLIQQGRSGPIADEDRFGEREEWGRIWTDGVDDRVKVVKSTDGLWETTRDGRVRVLCSKDTPEVRVFSVDVYEQEIPPGSRSAKHWHMADEVAYVISGSGESVQWEVEAEIAERYYARIAKEPTTHALVADDTVYVPQNHVHQYVNTGTEPLRILVVQNRLIKFLGYDKVDYLEEAPEFAGQRAGAAATAGVG